VSIDERQRNLLSHRDWIDFRSENDANDCWIVKMIATNPMTICGINVGHAPRSIPIKISTENANAMKIKRVKNTFHILIFFRVSWILQAMSAKQQTMGNHPNAISSMSILLSIVELWQGALATLSSSDWFAFKG